MLNAVVFAEMHGGGYDRLPGGYWRAFDGTMSYYGTSTINALESRGKVRFTEWRDGGPKGRYPIRAELVL